MSVEGNAEEHYRAACAAVIGRLRTRDGWSFREFGERVGAAHTTLYAIERGEAVPGIDILGRIAIACDLDLVMIMRMIVDELSLEQRGSSLTLSDLLSTISELSPAQRQDVLSFIEYLRFRDREQPR